MASSNFESPMSMNSSHVMSDTTPESFSEGSLGTDRGDNATVSIHATREEAYIKSEESMSEKSFDVSRSAKCPNSDCNERRHTLKYEVINPNSSDEDYVSDRLCGDCSHSLPYSARSRKTIMTLWEKITILQSTNLKKWVFICINIFNPRN
jgi:hypothetical protein